MTGNLTVAAISFGNGDEMQGIMQRESRGQTAFRTQSIAEKKEQLALSRGVRSY